MGLVVESIRKYAADQREIRGVLEGANQKGVKRPVLASQKDTAEANNNIIEKLGKKIAHLCDSFIDRNDAGTKMCIITPL
jgi:hypothetical protein